jgi:hypothetical protein
LCRPIRVGAIEPVGITNPSASRLQIRKARNTTTNDSIDSRPLLGFCTGDGPGRDPDTAAAVSVPRWDSGRARTRDRFFIGFLCIGTFQDEIASGTG